MIDSAAGNEGGGAAASATADLHRQVMAWRRQQRAELLAARLAMPAPRHREATRLIRRHLKAYLQQHRPAVLGGYWPIRREFNVLPSLRDQLAGGARVALPVIGLKNHPLEFRLWAPGVPMNVGVWNIPYPAEGAVVLPDALLLPMIGFDAAGFRLGYGGGYYDRTAAALLPRPQLIGIAFEGTQLASIRPLPHDIPMNCIITEQTIRTFGAHALGSGSPSP